MKNDNDHTQSREVNFRIDKYEYLKNMDTVKLQALLQQESFLSDDDNFDIELIQHIMAILDEREPIFEDFEVDSSLKSFKDVIVPKLNMKKNTNSVTYISTVKNTINRKFAKSRFAIAFLTAIIIIVLGSTFATSAIGHDFWRYVINWGKGTFHISSGAEVTDGPKVSGAAKSEGTINMGAVSSYQSVESAAKALKVSILIPKWIPDGFEFNKAEISDTPQRKSIGALYKFDEKVLMYNIIIYESSKASYSYEIDEGSGDTVTINGVQCYVMTNFEQAQVVWVDGNSVYSLSGNTSKENLIKMVKSIYEGED